MDEQRLQQALSTEELEPDTFTRLCQLFGGGGSNGFWAAARRHDWETARQLVNEAPMVPARTRRWLNKNGEAGGYHPIFPEV